MMIKTNTLGAPKMIRIFLESKDIHRLLGGKDMPIYEASVDCLIAVEAVSFMGFDETFSACIKRDGQPVQGVVSLAPGQVLSLSASAQKEFNEYKQGQISVVAVVFEAAHDIM